MAFIPKQVTQPVAGSDLPFASYAQIVRMLMPLSRKVSFHNAVGDALWISDGIEEPELRAQIEVLLARSTLAHASNVALDHVTSDQPEPVHVFPIRTGGILAGAIVVVFGELAENAAYRQFRTVERLLAPLIEILVHSWGAQSRAKNAAAAAPNTQTVATASVERPDQAASQDQVATADRGEASADAAAPLPLPALLRRVLALATHQLGCAFGTIVVPDRPFTLSHRLSADESDLAVTAAIDAVRTHMLRWMTVRNEPLIINGTAPSGSHFGTYKILALPLRPGNGPLAALLVLFRNRPDRNFVNADVDRLMLTARQIPAAALAELSPESVAAAKTSTPVRTVAQPSDAQAMTMDMRVRAALRDDAFNLYVQNISPLRSDHRPARFEVLLRMRELKAMHAPAAFFAAAEAGRLMPEVDRWVIANLLRTLRENVGVVRSARLEFWVNIAAQSLLSDRFSEFVVAEVCRSGIPADLLVFEVSEANAFGNQQALENFGARLRDIGCRMALDNCREGLGTFGATQRSLVSCVKIDGSVIRNVIDNPRCASLVRDVARHAAARGIETVAECVEAANIHDKLFDIGIDFAQGFHIGQPQPIATLFR
ncbi:MAG TPA: EAL domain-containing protein [Steroidobacteraceae bacterium]